MNPRLFIPRVKLMLHATIPTTIISPTQRCNIVATLFRMVIQHYSNICSAVLPIASCNITLRPGLQPRVRFILRLVIDSWSKEPSSNYHAGRSNFYWLASPLRIKSSHKEASAQERACVRKV